MAKLNSFQKAIEGKSGQALSKATLDFFGPISENSLPQGATITYRSPDGQRVEYTDSDGFTHVLQRNLDARLENLGTIKEETNRPAFVQDKQASSFLNNLINQQNAQVGKAPSLADLDDSALEALDRMAKAAQMASNQSFQERQGKLVADLYGRGTQNSTLANDAVARSLQEQGLVNAELSSDAANRELGIRQFLTEQGSQAQGRNLQAALELLGQNMQGQIASGQQDIQQQQVDNSYQQFLQQYRLDRDKFEYETNKSPIGKILGGLASAALAAGTGGSSTAITSGIGGLAKTALGKIGVGNTGTYVPGFGNIGG